MSSQQQDSPPSSVWCFYHIQNEQGESAQAPNAFRVEIKDGKRSPRYKDVIEYFPLKDAGSYHIRFRAALPSIASPSSKDKQIVYVDFVSPNARVPLVGGNVVAKVLNLDKATSACQNTPGLQRKSSSSGTRNKTTQGQGRPKQSGSTPRTTASMQSQKVDASPDNSNATPPPPPVQAEEEKLEVPEHVDEDLKDKSDFVKAKVMKRRNEERQKQKERVQALETSEKQAKVEQEQIDSSRQKLNDKIQQWAYDRHGQPKNIQALLSTLDSVLWEGASWTPVAMSQLLDPKKLRITYFKACRVVHPDKISSDADSDVKYIAQSVFHRLNVAYKEYEKTQQ